MVAIAAPVVMSALSLAMWAVASHVLSVSSAEPAVVVYTVGSIGWLIAGLGIPYLIPVLAGADIRSADAVNSLLASLCGFSVLLALSSWLASTLFYTRGFAPVADGIGYAVLLSLSGLLVQRGRVTSQAMGGLVFGAFLTSPFLPLLWISLSRVGTVETRTRVLSSIFLALTIFLATDILRKRRFFTGSSSLVTADPGDETKTSLRPRALAQDAAGAVKSPALRRALLLVPHLVAFSAISQGIRLMAWLLGSSELLVQIHYSLLFLNIGSTLVSAIHGVLSVRVQMLSTSAFAAAAVATGRRYGALGLLAAVTFVLAARPLASVILANSANLDWRASLGLAGTFGGITAYYAMSNSAMRQQWSGMLSCVSVSILAVVAVVVWIVRPEATVDNLVVFYAVAVWSLALVATLLVCVVREPSRGSGRLILRGELPFVAVSIVGSLIAIL